MNSKANTKAARPENATNDIEESGIRGDIRNDGVFQDRVSFDEIYARNLSLWFDLKIALLTIVVILQTTGK